MKKKTEEHYLRSDGNGGLNMSHSVAIISIIIMLFLAIIPAAVAWGSLKTKVDSHDTLVQDVDAVELNIAVMQENIINIDNDVTEIKSDVKKLLERN